MYLSYREIPERERIMLIKTTIIMNNGKTYVTTDEVTDEMLKREWMRIKSVFAPSLNDFVLIRPEMISSIEVEYRRD